MSQANETHASLNDIIFRAENTFYSATCDPDSALTIRKSVSFNQSGPAEIYDDECLLVVKSHNLKYRVLVYPKPFALGVRATR